MISTYMLAKNLLWRESHKLQEVVGSRRLGCSIRQPGQYLHG